MYLRCLLVPTAPGLDATPRLDAALRLSRRLHAHFAVAFIAPGDGAPGEDATAAKAGLRAWCEREGIPLLDKPERLDTTFASWTAFSGEIEPVLTALGRVNDLVVIDRPAPDVPFIGRILDTALFSVGRPALLVGAHLPDDLLRHVVIAWNGSLEAARLVGQSITLLHEAGRVTVVHAQTGRLGETPAADLCAYLRWHGIVAHAITVQAREGRSIGETILGEVEGLNASMLGLGAYTHSRVREFLLGGVTRHMIEKAKMPLLMVH